ncbi:MAG: glycosyltransferase family 4 protein [Kiritimatiellae bacterium]|nr:glycosyltransferase family 4 protein [Kiritimatiellia bacterium]
MKIAFCAPFYGPQASGGAEAECRKTVLYLHQAGIHVEVFTTCLIDLQHDWNINALPPGTTLDEGVPVHRFPAEALCKPRFAELNTRLIAGEKLTPGEEREFTALHINSIPLLRALDARRADFDRFCFIPYLFGTTIHGVRLCREKSVLIPCLHDEGYARLSAMETLFQQAGRIVFHTAAEQRLAHALYVYDHTADRLIGEGITTEFETNPERFRTKFNLHEPFILCAGRKHPTKNTHQLIDFFHRCSRSLSSPLKLVLIGPGAIPLPPDTTRITDLGYLAEQDKRDAYSAATLFCQPSLNESFSIVLMEAWDCQTPALVHGHCPVTREHAIASGGGLYYTTYPEFEGCVEWFLNHPETAAALGKAGQRYVRSNYTWPRMVQRYLHEVFSE